MRLSRFFIGISILVATGSPLRAQTDPNGAPPTGTVAVSLYLLDNAPAPPPAAAVPGKRPGYVNGGLAFSYPGARQKTESIPLRPALLSRAFVYHGTSPLVFYSETMVDGKPVRTPLASVAIPADWRQVCLLVSPAPAGSPLPSQIFPVRHDATAIPLDHAKIINLGAQAVLAQTQAGVREIAPKSYQVINYDGFAYSGLQLKLAADVRGKPRLVFADTIPSFAGTRLILLAYPVRDRVWQVINLSDNGEDASARLPEPAVSSGGGA